MEIFLNGSNSDKVAYDLIHFIKSKKQKNNMRILEVSSGADLNDVAEAMDEMNADITLINNAFKDETELREATATLSKHKGGGTVVYAVNFPLLRK